MKQQFRPANKYPSRFIRLLLIILGWFMFVLGIIGLLLPIVPTTPFLIVAAICFSKSSDRFYYWLINHKIFGSWIRDYLEKGGITKQRKIFILLLIFGSSLTSMLIISKLWVTISLLIFLIIITGFILSRKTI